jgi:protein TonB
MSTAARRGILALVIFFHVGGGWALTQVEPVKLIVGDIAPMEVRMVTAEEPAQPEIENSEPPPPVELTPPPVELATVVDPPPPDLPPPEFPLAKVDLPPPDEPPPPDIPPPEKKPDPKPPEPKPVQRKPQQQARPAAPVDSQPQQAAPAAPAAPHVVDASQLGYLVAPKPVYPKRAERAGEQGLVLIRVLIDIAGRPAQVSLEKSSGFPDLDQAALSAARAAQFRPYMVGGLPRAVLVIVPINFVVPK